jgi:hypothetical protein
VNVTQVDENDRGGTTESANIQQQNPQKMIVHSNDYMKELPVNKCTGYTTGHGAI